MDFIQETSFGTIPLKLKKQKWEVFLVQHVAKHWGFPKGHPEKSETPFETAIRELKEETSLQLKKVLREKPYNEKYVYQKENQRVTKQVFYFLIEVKGSAKIQANELIKGGWFAFKDAYKTITFSEGKSVLEHAKKYVLEQFA